MNDSDFSILSGLTKNLSSIVPQQQITARLSMPELPKMPVFRDYKMADYQYEVIRARIKNFEDELDDEHEVAVQLASFGKDILLNVTDIGYSNPQTLVFYGFVNGQNATLIQHISMLSFLLLAVRKQDPDKPPRRIGFCAENVEEEED